MSTYRIQISDGATDIPRNYPLRSTTLLGAMREATRIARAGYIGGTVEVLAVTGEYVDGSPAWESVYRASRAR